MYNGKIRGKDNQSSNQLGTFYFHDVRKLKISKRSINAQDISGLPWVIFKRYVYAILNISMVPGSTVKFKPNVTFW